MSQTKCIPFSIEEKEKLQKLYSSFGHRGNLVRTEPGNCVLPTVYDKDKDRFKHFQTRPDDVYILTFPKNGTTWTQELTWCLLNDCNVQKAKLTPLNERSPFLDFHFVLDPLPKDERSAAGFPDDIIGLADQLPSPRLIKSHLPFSLLPSNIFNECKVIICIRNPKDTAVSYYHHEKLLKVHGYEGDFATHFDLFMRNQCLFCPYFEYIVEAWKMRSHPNVCLIAFEEMKKDQPSAVRKVAKFLGKDVSDEKVDALVNHLDFKNMKNNKSVNFEEMRGKVFSDKGSFMRKGEVGDWKNHLTDDMNKRMDEAIEKNFKPIGLEFIYEF